MRAAFAAAVAEQADRRDVAFLTGDLGFMALEPVRDAFGERFINVGVAEQNMMGVAAGLASEGMRVYAYSIAPFAALRAIEQVKLDIADAGLSVCVVGNGGGYGYGHMGPTHHALSDLAVMGAVGMQCLIPAFDADVIGMVGQWTGPTYLRLGRQEGAWPGYADDPAEEAGGHDAGDVRRLLAGDAGHLIVLGPLAGLALAAFGDAPAAVRPAVWVCTRLPLRGLPGPLLGAGEGTRVVVAEEHLEHGGLGQQVGAVLACAGAQPRLVAVSAAGYPSGRYGSQAFHRGESGLDAAALRRLWAEEGAAAAHPTVNERSP